MRLSSFLLLMIASVLETFSAQDVVRVNVDAIGAEVSTTHETRVNVLVELATAVMAIVIICIIHGVVSGLSELHLVEYLLIL